MGDERKTIPDLSHEERMVLFCACRMDREGVYPTADWLAYNNADIPEHEVRRARADLIRWGLLDLRTSPPEFGFPEPDPADGDTLDFGSRTPAEDGTGDAAQARPDPKSRAYNIALYRIVDGKGSVYDALSTVLGISPNAVKCRVDHARNHCTSEELDPKEEEVFTPSEKRHLAEYLRKHDDPAVREWLEGVHSARRVRPDTRSQSRDCA